MSTGITQVRGIDTSVETFQPRRDNPVARRAIRKYYSQENHGTNTNAFDTLTRPPKAVTADLICRS